jgi:hypothetical protein
MEYSTMAWRWTEEFKKISSQKKKKMLAAPFLFASLVQSLKTSEPYAHAETEGALGKIYLTTTPQQHCTTQEEKK